MFNTKQLLLFYREKYVFLFCNAAAVALSGAILWIIGVIRPHSETIALHYDIFFGIDRLGYWYQLLGLATCILGIIVINAGIAYKIFARDKYLSYYLLLMGMLCPIFFVLYLVSLSIFALQA